MTDSRPVPFDESAEPQPGAGEQHERRTAPPTLSLLGTEPRSQIRIRITPAVPFGFDDDPAAGGFGDADDPNAGGSHVLTIAETTPNTCHSPALLDSALADDPTAFALDGGGGFGEAMAATDSTAAVPAGAVTIPVLDSSGFAPGDAIVVEPGVNEEVRSVDSVGGGAIVVSLALASAHAAGIEVRKTTNTGGRVA